MPAGEDSAWGNVGQCLLLQEAAGVVVTPQCGVAYIESERGKFRVSGDQLVYFAKFYCA